MGWWPNAATDDFDNGGQIHPGLETDSIGALLMRLRYDGLGRLIAMEKPLTSGGPDPIFQTEHYYYDP